MEIHRFDHARRKVRGLAEGETEGIYSTFEKNQAVEE